MKEDVLEYIKNEKDIAKYNKYILQRKKQTPSTMRLIAMEDEFVSIPFETLNLNTIQEAEDAISLYRKSRNNFYIKYNISDKTAIESRVKNKILFLDKIASELRTKCIEEVNPVQNKFFFDEMVKYFCAKNDTTPKLEFANLRNKTIDELKAMEPAILAKKRAKLQASFFSLGLAIDLFTKNLIELEKDMVVLNEKLDTFIDNINKYIYKYYNDALNILPQSICNTMGENIYINKIYKLNNIFNMYAHSHACVHTLYGNIDIKFDSPKIYNVYYGIKKPFIKSLNYDSNLKTKNKTFAIIFPINRTSCEKMTSMYTEILYKGQDISELFCDEISNIRIKNSIMNEEYFKGIFLRPIWELIHLLSINYKYKPFIEALLQESICDLNIFNNKDFLNKINKKTYSPIDIDLSSIILIQKTRSEEYRTDSIMSILNLKIEQIKNDYQNIE